MFLNTHKLYTYCKKLYMNYAKIKMYYKMPYKKFALNAAVR